MNFQLTKEFIELIELLITQQKNGELIKIFDGLLAPDIAEVLELLDFKKSKYLFDLFNQELSADVLIDLDDYLRERLLDDLSSKEIVEEFIDNLDSDDAADVIQEFPKKRQEEILSNIVNPKQASDLADLLSYEDSSAGALMAKELIKVYENWSILRCVSEMRKQAQSVSKVYTIYVVNEDQKLIGTVSLKKLLLTPEKTFISEIYNKQIISVDTSTSAEKVAWIMNKYDLIVLPVINIDNQLVGRITIDDVVDVMKEEAEKDYQMASGISDNIEPLDSIWSLTKARIPWLIIGMIGGLLGAQIIGLFKIEENPLLAFFIPLITAMGGNVGVQSSAIIVQGLAANNLGMDHWSKRLIKEFSVALVNGLICCVILFIMCMLLYPQPSIPITVSMSLLTVMIFAALFGTFIPLILNKNNIDPALATGPFITTMNDVIGLFIYFSIAKLML